MGKQQSWKWQLGVRGSKRDYSLSVNPFPFKLSWNGTSAAGHKLLECVCISGKTCLCSSKGLPLLFASAQPVCDSFQGHPSTISFTVFSLWHHVLNLFPVFCEAACCWWKREGYLCGFPTSSISKPCSKDNDLLENIISLFPLCCLSFTQT